MPGISSIEAQLENLNICLHLAEVFEPVSRRLTMIFWNKALELAVLGNWLGDADLDTKVLACAEEYLKQKYPELNLTREPERLMLFGRYAQETREAIYIQSITQELENISAKELEDPKVLAAVEQMLSKAHPGLDLNTDPASELLEGAWKEEADQVIDQLVSQCS